jgi:hypothetical protein
MHSARCSPLVHSTSTRPTRTASLPSTTRASEVRLPRCFFHHARAPSLPQPLLMALCAIVCVC